MTMTMTMTMRPLRRGGLEELNVTLRENGDIIR
jgi:hypothetical protein